MATRQLIIPTARPAIPSILNVLWLLSFAFVWVPAVGPGSGAECAKAPKRATETKVHLNINLCIIVNLMGRQAEGGRRRRNDVCLCGRDEVVVGVKMRCQL